MGCAAGRCEFAGCNRPLWKSDVTQEEVNVAQKAHIYAFSKGGPRHDAKKRGVNSLSNLILVCHGCHRKIDKEKDGGRYTASLLQQWKKAHEERIERVTGVALKKKSHILIYGAKIGDHSGPLNYQEAAVALFPSRYPASDKPIELSTHNDSFSDRDSIFWSTESENLRRKFEKRVRERIADGDLDHLSVFGLAPQPLLVLLGTLLGDIVAADVFQRHREPATWTWPSKAVAPPFKVVEPKTTNGPPALILALSATVTADRIHALLGTNASIWTITLPKPHNDVLKSRLQLADLRELLRPLLNRIKAFHGQNTPLHIFPAAPVAAVIELGRVRMPKADMPWHLYDQVNDRGGFVLALTIPEGD